MPQSSTTSSAATTSIGSSSPVIAHSVTSTSDGSSTESSLLSTETLSSDPITTMVKTTEPVPPILTASQLPSSTPTASSTIHKFKPPVPLIICIALVGQIILVGLIIIIWRRYKRRPLGHRQPSPNTSATEPSSRATAEYQTSDHADLLNTPSRTTLTSAASSMLDIDSTIVIGREDGATRPAYTETVTMTMVPSTPGPEIHRRRGDIFKGPILV